MTYKTFTFRIKDKSKSHFLIKCAHSTNTVWNYCNEISQKSSHKSIWINDFELEGLTNGSSALLNIPAQSIRIIVRTFINRRNEIKKPKLRWRTNKSLGWIPFTKQDVQIKKGTIQFRKEKIPFWEHRKIEGEFKSGSFSQDARGRWYINLTYKIEKKETTNTKIIGIDLGLKSIAKTTTDEHLEVGRFYRDLEKKISRAQSKKKKKLIKTLRAKASNRRRDTLHKFTRKLVDQAGAIFVGDISTEFMISRGQGKAALDSSWGLLRNYLRYKCDYAGVVYAEVNEAYTTQMCSNCKGLTGPKGEEGLSVRQWVCSGCGSNHDRDINAAYNIARLGCEMVGLPTRLN